MAFLTTKLKINFKYIDKNGEAVRKGLERDCRFKGCSDTSTLAAETMGRVAAKLESLGKIDVNPNAYLLGFASNIVLEHRRTAFKEMEYHENLHSSTPADNIVLDARSDCQSKCMSRLPMSERGRQPFPRHSRMPSMS